jgi:magnesium and cobalt transporter
MGEMEKLIAEGSQEGVINPGESEMLLSVLEFRRTMVREVMIPRTEMSCVEVSSLLEELLGLMRGQGHSRIPVYEEKVDRIVGIVHARDLLPHWGCQAETPPIADLMRPAYFVPETMRLEKLLAEMRARKTHLAISVDEYGGVSGLITLEDILEEIVGDIQDEYDDESEVLLRKTSEGLEVSGRCDIELLEEELGRRLDAPGDFETVGGLVVSVMGRIPKAGERFVYEGLEFKVRDVDTRRVRAVTIFPKGEADKGEADKGEADKAEVDKGEPIGE